MPDLKERIMNLLKSTDKPLSVDEIIIGIKEKKSKKAQSTIRQSLRSLEDENAIISFSEPRKTVGRPGKLYRPIEKRALLRTITREEHEEQNLLRELIDDSAGRYSTMPFNKVQLLFKAAGENLLKENPRKMFINFAEWLKMKHAAEITSYKQFLNKGLRKEAEKHRKNIIGLEKIANEVFTRMIGVPSQIRQKGGKLRPGPLTLKFNTRTYEDESAINLDELEQSVNLAVHGTTVFEKFCVEGNKPPIHIGGSDTSIQGISLSRILPWLVERSEMNIITAVGVRYNIYKDSKDLDRYPEPKVLAQYERNQAIEEGLLIPPSGTLGYRPEMENRIKEAAMDLRQYIKDFDLMFRNEPAVKIHFRDGRVFPYEHRLSDALQIGFHGDLVRSSLKILRNLTNLIGIEKGKVLYCGFVKRPGVRLIAPLIMWYIGFGSKSELKESIDPKMTLDSFLRSPYRDNYIVNQIFSVLQSLLGNNEVFVTFRLLRRFQSMEEPYVQNFKPTADVEVWTKRLSRYCEDYLGSSEDSGGELIATLCSRASIVQFYASLSINPYYEQHAHLPRIEFLLPFPDFENCLNYPESGNKNQVEYIKRILGTLFYPGVLENYSDSLYYFSSDSPEVFFIPKTVREAHDSSKLIAKIYRDDFIELLIREARWYWTARVRGPRQFIP
jgi:DNA-binding transcriptional ArsR family regulator